MLLPPLEKKRTVSSSKSPRASKKVQEKYGRAMPIWLRNILTVMIVGCFSAVFYYFSFVLMPIVGNLVTV